MSAVQNKTPSIQLSELVNSYLEAQDKLNRKSKDIHHELETRFGTKGYKGISRVDYDNVIKKLISIGFRIVGNDKVLLRMSPEYIDPKTGLTKISNVRVEIDGIAGIKEYCRTNNINPKGALLPGINFQIKSAYKKNNESESLKPADFNDWNFRVSLQTEKNLDKSSSLVMGLIDTWTNSKKIFRLINRVSFVHNEYPFIVDLSIVRENKRRGKYLVPEFSFEASGVMENPAKYEIEFEVDYIKLESYSSQLLENQIKKMAKEILAGIQQTNYPVSYDEQKQVLTNYMKLIKGDDYDENKRIYTKDFIGPSSYTLSIKNIAPINDDSNIPNIRKNYTVTDKADGDRKLMYISETGKIYLIDTNMNVQFTGSKTEQKEIFNSLLDGEHVLHNKLGKFINLYAAFDIYFIKGKDVRNRLFVPLTAEDVQSNFRLPLLVQFVKSIKPSSSGIVSGVTSSIRIETKSFYAASDKQSIFQACGIILKNVKEGLYEYETDGLIFTPARLGVGMNSPVDTIKNTKSTWEWSFKWKPTEYNTIDFLVSTKKLANNQDYVGNIFQDGTDASSLEQLTQYKTIILRVGFDERKHGYLNPCADIINDNLPDSGNKDDEETYKPMQFFPTNPYDPEGGICNIILKDDSTGTKRMFTENNEIFDDNTIVEFKYDITRDKQWRWIPLRVRYDKTAELQAGGKNFGNAYHVANSNWNSLHNPITEEMISSGENIPDELGDDDIYYNKVTNASQTRALRDFHNLYVKNLLITKNSKKGGTIIDLACGKGGDIPKWISSKAEFVLGLDISKDNIENRLDGACARYLNYRKKFKIMPNALFVHGDTSKNIRDGDALYTDKGKQIIKAVFGSGPKDAKVLGKGVFKQYGKATKGFDLTSIQFAIHYMFENQETLQNFLRNVSECTKVGGMFIGTCYDGKIVFDQLRDKKQGESMYIMYNNEKLWQVTKEYDRDTFVDDESCLGYKINVYQESINKEFSEYLVNYNYLVRLLENYGLVPLTVDECKRLGIPATTGLFSELYGLMENELRRYPENKAMYGDAMNMTPNERRISFLNRYFVFKKVRDVDAQNVSQKLLNISPKQSEIEQDETKQANLAVKEELEQEKVTFVPRKLKRKVKLVLVSE